MVTKKDLVIAVLCTFCLTSTLFMMTSTRSSPDLGEYDPWIDLNDDGYIDVFDAVALAGAAGTSGTPINKTALLLELQNEVDDLKNRISILETLHGLPIVWLDGLVGYWKFDEGSGIEAFDSSGSGNNGTLENNPTWVDGKYGTGLNFDGINDYVAIPDLYSTSPTELTVSAWINSSLVTTWWRGDSIIHHCRHGEFGLQLVYSGVICFGVKVASGVGLWDVRWDPSPNEWHQIVGTWKKGDSLKLYVDGTLVNQTAANDEFLYDAYWEDAAIGSLYRSEAFFNGTIDEVMVYNRTLSAGEVAAQYATPP